ncbi:protein ORF129 [Cyprinid herpesvirus 1]|uniref:Protein ORF129 n=1 Tax=Cyprinid herpesvirus 1 TaxID=317858 RepID=K7PBY3_9VIRU|nr:protein ORF129 [Cyprinid herpesvirus 1]AFJ20418.1 protein ORF129 [Cyprinid herpesvirus 1]
MESVTCCLGIEASEPHEFPSFPDLECASLLLQWSPLSKSHRDVYKFGRRCWLVGGFLGAHPNKGKGKVLLKRLSEDSCPSNFSLLLWWRRSGFPTGGRIHRSSNTNDKRLATAMWILGWHCMRHSWLQDIEPSPRCAHKFLPTLVRKIKRCRTLSRIQSLVFDLVDGSTLEDYADGSEGTGTVEDHGVRSRCVL